MKKTIITLTIALIITGIALAMLTVSAYNQYTEKEKNEFDYVWTKALCEGNTCQDYEIVCKNGNVIEMTPVTGLVSFSKSWEDPREKEFKKKYCDLFE